ncbi:MAG: 2TM domain-containing protein, partial [Myxococcota bacterium]|nr:2TM domain-containing protein [Myxococcota bacterium]
MSDERGRPQYSRDEVEEILRRAAERTHEQGGEALTHDELVAAAREAGIDTSAVEEAASSLAETRQDRLAVEQWSAARKRRFVSHVMTWLVVNSGLFLIDLLSGGGWWFYWPLLAWGMAVALQAVGALREPTPEQVERVTRRARRKREAERKRQARS